MRPPGPSIRSVDLDDERTCFAEMSSQRGTVGAGALNADSIHHAVALQPLHQGAITHRRCGKLPIAELASEVIDHGGMVALSVCVHATGNTNRGPCHAGHANLFRSQRSGGRTPRSGSVDKPVMGAFCAGSYEVTPPGRSRATTSSTGPTDRPKDSNPWVRLTESQTRQKTSSISSLAYGTERTDRTDLSALRQQGEVVWLTMMDTVALLAHSKTGERVESPDQFLRHRIVALMARAAEDPQAGIRPDPAEFPGVDCRTAQVQPAM